MRSATLQQSSLVSLAVHTGLTTATPPEPEPVAPRLPWLTADVARALGAIGGVSSAGVAESYPALVEAAYEWQAYYRHPSRLGPEYSCTDRLPMIGLVATARVEVGWNFVSTRERITYAAAEANYGAHTRIGQQLGNVYAGDGYRYRGGGLIQRTGRGGYAEASRRLALLGIELDLVADPDAILPVRISALVAVDFFLVRDLEIASRAREWEYVRYRVNGGTNGLDDFLRYVAELDELPMLA